MIEELIMPTPRCCRMLSLALALTLAVLAAQARAECRLEPPAGVTNSLRSPGDGGHGLHISGDPERYVPGSVYTSE